MTNRTPLQTATEPIANAFKVCACGLKYTATTWRELPFVGVQEQDAAITLELRNCACGSTLCVERPARYVCGSCGESGCRSATCGEECGIRGLPRMRRVA